MSLESWSAEFYPTSARECANSKGMIATIQHSLRKWRGFSKENLEKHDLSWWDTGLYRSAGACSLCEKYGINFCDNCASCPVTRCGEKSCIDNSLALSPYKRSKNLEDPAPMINTLEKTLEWARKRHGKE